jgi:hypothetical protein
VSSYPLDPIDRIVDVGGDADDVLRAVVEALVARPDVDWAGVRFLEAGELSLGPAAGSPDETRRRSVTISFRGDPVGELAVDGGADQKLLETVASRISEYVLLGWDTDGQVWEP